MRRLAIIPALGAALLGLLAVAPQPRLFLQPNLGRGAPVVLNSPTPAFVLARQVLLAQPSQIPPCSVLTSGSEDYECVMQCGFFPWASDYDGGFACYGPDAGRGDFAITQSSVLSIDSVSPFYLSDGGWHPVQAYTDDTAGAGATYQVDSATVRSTFGGAHTIVFTGYWSSTGVDPTGWASMITDGTRQMQLRRAGGNQLQLLEGTLGQVATSSGDCIDNWCSITARNFGDGGMDISQGGNSTFHSTDMAAITGSNHLYIGGGVGGCCTPQGAMGGPLGPFTLYRTAKSDYWREAVNRSLWGAQAIASGAVGQVGNLGVRIARYDLDKTGGGLNVLGAGDYYVDPLVGAHTNQTYHVLGPVDSLDGGALTGSGATWRGHFDRGPFYHWKHQNAAGVFSAESTNAVCMTLGSVGGDGGNINTNASFIGTAFTDGGYGYNNLYWIQNVCTGGVIDGGFDHCTGTVSGGGVFARYPSSGCPMACSGATGTVKSLLCVGDAGATGALELAQIQMTDTLEFEPPSVTNAQVSAQYIEIDAGAVPSGCNAGKVAAVFQTAYSSSWYPAVMNSGTPPATFSYIYDISDTVASHDVLQWTTVEGDSSKMDALLYGSDQNYITPNKFASGGQYAGADAGYVSQQFAATSMEWYIETGTLPDGGTGQGARAIERYDQCSDQSSPLTCSASTVINQNTGQLGLCPGTSNFFEVGTRALGTGPSTSAVHHINICSCPANLCTGACQ